ncbi:MAG TPA: HAD family hydrolase [Pirellulales bacterium]|jgi:HAD superfamily hydrolase (TIGR01549 family)|nr:HAD family hydrolase [Pirellulales bacterium]
MAAFIFDLDGTLVDTAYAHVSAWQQALHEAGLEVDAWRIHRRIGMSGGLLLHALSDELDCQVTSDQAQKIDHRHCELFRQTRAQCRPLRGAVKLLRYLKEQLIPFGIATSGTRPGIDPSLKCLGIEEGVVVVTGKKVSHPKPEPDALLACQQQLGAEKEDCFVVGDAVWDLLAAGRARMFSIGLLSGGYGATELFEAGAYRVFSDPAHLQESLYQLGIGT